MKKELEDLGMAKVERASDLDDGDIIVIPSYEDETRLRVTPGTLRKWGLSMCESSRPRYGSASYKAVKRAFGSPGWPDVDAECLEAHAFFVRNVVRDSNHRYERGLGGGSEAMPEVEVSFADANSVDDVAVVRTKKDPLVSATLVPFSAMRWEGPEQKTMPLLLDVDGKPRKERIINMLLEAVGPGGFPTSRMMSTERSVRDAVVDDRIPDLNAMSALVTMMSSSLGDRASRAGMFGIAELGKFEGILDGCGYFDSACPEMSRFVMTSKDVAAGDFDGKYHDKYVRSACGLAMRMSMYSPAKFLSNIMARGALAYRSDNLSKVVDMMFAKEMAKMMAIRYKSLNKWARMICKELSAEFGKVDEIIGMFEKAAEKLSVGEGVEKAVNEFGGKL